LEYQEEGVKKNEMIIYLPRRAKNHDVGQLTKKVKSFGAIGLCLLIISVLTMGVNGLLSLPLFPFRALKYLF